MTTLDLALAPQSRSGPVAGFGEAARRLWRAVQSCPAATPVATSGSREVCLVADGCHRIWKAAGRRIECHAGTAWITLDGDSRDIVLDAGESFVVDRDTAALIFALHDSARLTVGEPSPAVRQERRRLGWMRAALVAVAAGLGVVTVQAAQVLAHLSAAVHLAS